MPLDRFLIAPLNSGWQNDVRPWLVPDDAYAQLRNAYAFRSRIRKRVGSVLMQGTTPPTPGYEQLQSRLRMLIGVTVADAFAGGAGTVPGTIAIGQMISCGDNIFTVSALGAPANLLRTDGSAGAATLNTATGAINLVNIGGASPVANGTSVYFYHPRS